MHFQMKKVATLVIHAPKNRKKSFEDTLADGIGAGYAIYQKDRNKLQVPGSIVVLLRNNRNQRRAEGRLVKLQKTNRQARPGVWRYNVYVDKFTEVPYNYKPEEKLNRHGVAVFDC